MTDIRALAERLKAIIQPTDDIKDAIAALSTLSTENAELKRQLNRVDSMCASLWYDGMGGLYDGDNDTIIKEAWARHAERDPDFKREFDAHASRLSNTGKE